MTGITEITRNANTAMRGLTSISSRLTQVLDEGSSTGKKIASAYKELGIEVFDENNQMRDAMDIWTDLAKIWPTLDGNTQKYIATISAGSNQVKNFSAMMQNFGTVLDATSTAFNSNGSAMQENERAMDSIAKKIEILKSKFQEIVLEGGFLQNSFKDIIDVGIKFLDVLDTTGGKFAVLSSSLALLSAGLSGLIKKEAERILVSQGVTAAVAAETIATEGLSGAIGICLASLKALFSTSTLVVGGIIAISAAILALEEHASESFDRQVDKVKSLSSETEKHETEVNNLKEEYKRLGDEIEIAESQGNTERVKQLQLERVEIERQIAALEIENEKLRESLDLEAQKLAVKSGSIGMYDDEGVQYASYNYDSLEEGANKLKEILQDTQDEIDALKEKQYELIESGGELTDAERDEFEQYQSQIEEKESLQDSLIDQNQKIIDGVETLNDVTGNSKWGELVEAFNQFIGASEEATEETEEVVDALEEEEEAIDEDTARLEALAEAHGIAVDDLNKLAKATGMSAEALLDYADAMGVSVEQAASYIQSIESWNNSIDSLQDAYGKLTSAVEEYNKSGELSLDTLQNLLALSPEYLAMLTEENGKLVLNEQAIINKAQALIEERKQTALQMAYDKLAAIERGENARAADNEASSVSGNTGALQEETSALSMNTIEQMRNKIARSGNSADTSAANKVVRELQNELKVIDKIGQQYGKVSASAIKSGNDRSKASKGASKAIDEETKALQDLKKQYETVISWINKQYDRKIKEIQKAKSAAVKGVQDEINALKKREKVELDSITKTINARKSEKKEALDAIELQIKLIEKEEDLRIGSLKKDKKALEKQRDDELDDLQDKIDLLKEQKDAVLDATQTEIDSLKELKEERQAYWDEEINRLKEANEERKDALELQQYLDNLEKAKNTKVKVYKQDEGFVYDTDQTQVNQAQEALDKYLSEKAYEDELARLEALKQAELENYQDRIDALTKFKEGEAKNYQAQIDDLTKLKNERKKVYEEELDALTELIEAEKEQYDIRLELLEEQKDVTTEYYEVMIDELEEYKDTVEESYEQQIEALEAHKDALEDNYDKEIEMYRNYKEQFQDMVDEYENAQAKLLFEQLTGLSAENDNWMTRLDNLRQFVNAYNSLQAQLNTATTNASASYGGTGSVNYKPVATTTTPKTTTTTTKQYSPTTGVDSKGYNTYGTTSSSPKSTGDAASREALARINHKATTYATGVDKVPDDKVALVGEAPNTELVIGSKINSGKLMSLPKDTGVVNAKSTKSMAGLLNQLGQFGGSAFGAGNGTLNNNTTSNDNSFNVNGVTINGANITDPQSFATALLNFKNQALQRAYKRV